MPLRRILTAAAVGAMLGPVDAHAQQHLNPVVDFGGGQNRVVIAK